MNIALSTLVILIFLLPGIIFRRFYYTEEFSKQYFTANLFDTFTTSFVPSVLLQTGWYYLVEYTNYPVDLGVIGELLTARGYPEKAVLNIERNITPIFWYNASIIVMSGVLGYGFKKIIRKNKLDRKFKLFRFQNSWHYLIKGEIFDFPRFPSLKKDTVEKIEFVFVDALVETDSGSMLYQGSLADYELSKNQELEHIALIGTKRKFMNGTDDTHLHTIKGNLVVLPYCHIKNLNFTYFKWIQQEDGRLHLKEVS